MLVSSPASNTATKFKQDIKLPTLILLLILFCKNCTWKTTDTPSFPLLSIRTY